MDQNSHAFLAKAASSLGEDAARVFAQALEWSKAKHGPALRASGEPAWEHDLRVASTLLDMGMDRDSILAGLVHDCTDSRISGSPAALAEQAAERGSEPGAPASAVAPTKPEAAEGPQQSRKVRKPSRMEAKADDKKREAQRRALSALPDEAIIDAFGLETARLVAGVSRLSSVRAKNKTVQAAETMRKMLFAMTGDIRVIIVKLADKLDSMRTLKYLPEERQKTIATECLDIFAPLADRLGISWLKGELEDLALKTLNREIFEQIKDIVSAKKDKREKFLARASEDLRRAALKAGIPLEISSRAKHFYSIYQKMKSGKSPEELFDLSGLRLICETENDCYSLLGLVHRLWKPIDGRFKDYIAMPKANGYRSLHTTVMCYDGRLLEVQIRTKLMHAIAEYGVASHWLYKKGTTTERPSLEDLPVVNRLKQWNEFVAQGAEYLEEIKKELLGDSIFVFTPRGEVIELPSGATAIDFAFAIHTDVGAHCLGAKADGSIIPLDAELKNTQVVEILTSPQAHPNLNWLKLAHTSKAKSKIRALLVNSGQVLAIDKSIVVGKKPDRQEERQKEGLQQEDARFHPERILQASAEPAVSEVEYRAFKPGQELRSDAAGLSIGGAKNMMIRIAGCCSPVTGDSIVGYVSRGRGIIIHRSDCKSIRAVADFAERRMEVRWEDASLSIGRFRITAKKVPDIFAEIESAVRKYQGRLREGKLGERGDGTLSGFFTMETDTRENLKRVSKSLKGLPSIISIEEE
ncbi:MAG TPA: RelA/SpoT family protein [Rectinemataceae bacterium]